MGCDSCPQLSSLGIIDGGVVLGNQLQWGAKVCGSSSTEKIRNPSIAHGLDALVPLASSLLSLDLADANPAMIGIHVFFAHGMSGRCNRRGWVHDDGRSSYGFECIFGSTVPL